MLQYSGIHSSFKARSSQSNTLGAVHTSSLYGTFSFCLNKNVGEEKQSSGFYTDVTEPENGIRGCKYNIYSNLHNVRSRGRL